MSYSYSEIRNEETSNYRAPRPSGISQGNFPINSRAVSNAEKLRRGMGYKKDTIANGGVGKTGEEYAKLMNQQLFHATVQEYAKPSRFLIEFNVPKTMEKYIRASSQAGSSNEGSFDVGKIALLCHSVSLPQKSFETYEHKQLGVKYKVPYSLNYEPITITFYCDGDMESRRFFEKWHKSIIDDANATLNFYEEFITDVKIKLLDVEGKVRYSIVLEEAFPLVIANVDLSYGSVNALLSASVTMSYKKWNEEFKE